ncbi:MAG: hypothetical protein AB1730_16085 [Myxococcota bacterium]|jgi:hypothetical protein
MTAVRALSAVLLLASLPAFAQGLTGTWSGPTGKLSLKQSGKSVTGTALMEGGDRGTVSATVNGAKVTGSISYDGDKETFVGTLSGNSLRLVFEGDEEGAETFTRGGKGAPVAEEAPAPMGAPDEPTGGPAAGMPPSGKAQPAPNVAAATGGTFKSPEGWSVRAPANWKFGEKAGRVLFGSDTEAGLIVAWFTAGGTYQQMQEVAAQGINEDGFVLSPTGAAQAVQTPAGKGLGVDLQGAGQDGQPLVARAVGVAGPQGTVAVLGLTTPQQIAQLRPKVDAMAKSVAFFKPTTPAGVQFLRGSLCSYSGGAAASWTRRVNFDGRGHCSSGSEMAFGGQFTDQGGNNTGFYVGAAGNQYAANAGGTYTVSGNTVTVNLDGNVYQCTVNMRQGDGRITELMCDGKLFAAGLCE